MEKTGGRNKYHILTYFKVVSGDPRNKVFIVKKCICVFAMCLNDPPIPIILVSWRWKQEN